ncbi:hypothetical protein, partial [Aquimixticola soesokkakensis]|uniref:hypothetical protein n=1 Tax=Aquimixticola soesokkakensis TaxID=1519096 RepID=UPI001177B9F4
MFCPVGHVSLAELWREFCAKYRVRLTRAIMEKYGADDFELLDLHGAPDDYCEDVFLSTLSGMPMFAAFADGRLRRLETENDAGHSTLFAKMSAYESYLAARDP